MRCSADKCSKYITGFRVRAVMTSSIPVRLSVCCRKNRSDNEYYFIRKIDVCQGVYCFFHVNYCCVITDGGKPFETHDFVPANRVLNQSLDAEKLITDKFKPNGKTHLGYALQSNCRFPCPKPSDGFSVALFGHFSVMRAAFCRDDPRR